MFTKRELGTLYQVMKASLLLTMAACCTLGTAMALPRVPRPQEHIQRAYTLDLNEIGAKEASEGNSKQLQYYGATMNPNVLKKYPSSNVENLEEEEADVDNEDDSEQEALGALNLQKLLQYYATTSTINPKFIKKKNPSSNVEYLEEEEVVDNEEELV